MQNVLNIIGLGALVYYLPIPVVLTFIHILTRYWQRIGKISYFIFILLFLSVDAVVFGLVYQHRTAIVENQYFHPVLFTIGLCCLCSGVTIGLFGIQKLSIRTLFGVPQILPQKTKSKLVVDGIYRFIRHPRYLEFFLEYTGIALMTGFVLNLKLVLFLWIAILIVIAVEERELLNRYPAEYRKYKKRTGRLIPKFRF